MGHADDTRTISINRRRFVIGSAQAAGGLAIGLALPGCSTTGTEDAAAALSGDPAEVTAWALIHPDDRVVIRVARSEMGQGTLTGLAQLVAEELECDWAMVSTEYPTPGENLARDRVWGNFSTGGSRGIRGSHQYVREGGAAGRMLLIEAAAQRWGVDAATCSAANSVVTHGPSGRTARFGELAAAAAQLAPPAEVPLKDPKDWKLIGTGVPRLDTADKLTGKQIYGADLNLPGMVNASVVACPVRGGTRKSYDAAKVENMPGVLAVVPLDEDAVAVVADTWWRANQAIKALPVSWETGESGTVDSAGISAMLDEGLSAEDAFVGNQAGDVEAGLAAAATTHEAVYSYPFLHHATMEPMNATALWTEEKCEVWCPTQNGEAALAAAADAAGLPIEQCDVHKLHLGGGFGRRGAGDFVRQAVLIARTMPGTPVKLLWSREEDMRQGMYHPITKAKMTGGIDADGKLTALHLRISGQSILAGLRPSALQNGADLATFQALLPASDHKISYTIPNLLVDHAMRNTHLRPGFWRGVNVNPNAIYMECFLDEMADKAGVDALVFRRQLMADNPKGLAVLEAAAENGGWGEPLADGRGRGLALCYAFGSYVAACAEVSVDDAGKLTMHRITAATDPGHVVNTQQVEAQVEGSFVYGLSALLYGECTVKDGQVEQDNFHTYPSMRIAEMPQVTTIAMPSGGFWGGVGEPTIAVAAPAVLNAIYNATGVRIRQVPIKDTPLRKA
ncbi:MAG: molybdopterin cofactor-binding domain-containing protein [Pseudomonadota bacterium]